MEVTLNYTSKGLIHAIRTQLEQQKKEGKIVGDTSYKSIATCDFWSTLKEINDKHDKNNKVFHGKGYSCDNRGKNTDWTKTIVVYGSTTFSEEEWESLLNSMGLQLSSKVEKEEPKAEVSTENEQVNVDETKDQPKVEETVKEEPVQDVPQEKEENTPVEENKKEFAMPIATMAGLMAVLEENGYQNSVQATDLIQTALNCKVNLSQKGEIEITNAEGKKLSEKDENGKTILSKELREALEIAIQKENAKKAAETKTETPVETGTEDDENCTEDEE